MTRYSYTKVVNTDKLDSELKVTNLPYAYLEVNGTDQLRVWMNQDLSVEQESALTMLIQGHDSSEGPVDPVKTIANKIFAAMNFGRGVIAEYGARNILAGFTVEQIQEILNRTIHVAAALNTGSLYVAIDELNKVQTDDLLITPATVKYYRNKIEDYLQIPRT